MAKSRYWKVMQSGKIEGYISCHDGGDPPEFEGTFGYAWTNWYDENGKFVRSIERLNSIQQYVDYVNTTDDPEMKELSEEEFKKLKKETQGENK